MLLGYPSAIKELPKPEAHPSWLLIRNIAIRFPIMLKNHTQNSKISKSSTISIFHAAMKMFNEL